MNHFLTVIGLGLGVTTLYVALDSNKSSWDIAKQSGAFKTTSLDLSVSGNVPILDGVTTKLLIGVPIREKKEQIIGNIPINLKSTGERTVKNVDLSFAYKEGFNRESLEKLRYKTFGPIGSQSLQRSINKSKDYTYSTYTIGSINPGMNVVAHEPIYLKPTLSHTWLYDKRSKPITFSTHYTTSGFPKFEVMVNAENFPMKSFTMEAIVVELKSHNDLMNVALKKLVKSTCDKIRKDSTFFGYLNALVFEHPTDRVHIVFPADNGKISMSLDKKVFSERPWVSVMEINLVTWSRLIFI